ncbi:hypothetical protein E4U48_003604 [Claviceps purpurea]|nr:hypothetical protein E4U48_003604 [Claviceps purpurea]
MALAAAGRGEGRQDKREHLSPPPKELALTLKSLERSDIDSQTQHRELAFEFWTAYANGHEAQIEKRDLSSLRSGYPQLSFINNNNKNNNSSSRTNSGSRNGTVSSIKQRLRTDNTRNTTKSRHINSPT